MFCDDDGDGFSVNNYGNSDRHENEKVEEEPQNNLTIFQIGTGQSQTDYLAQHRAEQQEMMKKMQEAMYPCIPGSSIPGIPDHCIPDSGVPGFPPSQSSSLGKFGTGPF